MFAATFDHWNSVNKRKKNEEAEETKKTKRKTKRRDKTRERRVVEAYIARVELETRR